MPSRARIRAPRGPRTGPELQNSWFLVEFGLGVGVPSRRTDENVFATNWSRRAGLRSLSGLTVGIVGFGEIGVETVRRLRAFGCRMLYNKRTPLPQRVEAELGIEFCAGDALYAQSDILCNLLPYSQTTDGLIDGSVFARMPPGSYSFTDKDFTRLEKGKEKSW